MAGEVWVEPNHTTFRRDERQKISKDFLKRYNTARNLGKKNYMARYQELKSWKDKKICGTVKDVQ
jgi:hypothetical protein